MHSLAQCGRFVESLIFSLPFVRPHCAKLISCSPFPDSIAAGGGKSYSDFNTPPASPNGWGGRCWNRK